MMTDVPVFFPTEHLFLGKPSPELGPNFMGAYRGHAPNFLGVIRSFIGDKKVSLRKLDY